MMMNMERQVSSIIGVAVLTFFVLVAVDRRSSNETKREAARIFLCFDGENMHLTILSGIIYL